jgi:biotin carboxyl carrier protein
MQSDVYASVAGRISKIHVAPGRQVEGKDLLFTITTREPAV